MTLFTRYESNIVSRVVLASWRKSTEAGKYQPAYCSAQFQQHEYRTPTGHSIPSKTIIYAFIQNISYLATHRQIQLAHKTN